LVLGAAKGVDTFTNAIKDGSAAAVALAAAINGYSTNKHKTQLDYQK
jgi:hypothetical protein